MNSQSSRSIRIEQLESSSSTVSSPFRLNHLFGEFNYYQSVDWPRKSIYGIETAFLPGYKSTNDNKILQIDCLDRHCLSLIIIHKHKYRHYRLFFPFYLSHTHTLGPLWIQFGSICNYMVAQIKINNSKSKIKKSKMMYFTLVEIPKMVTKFIIDSQIKQTIFKLFNSVYRIPERIIVSIF